MHARTPLLPPLIFFGMSSAFYCRQYLIATMPPALKPSRKRRCCVALTRILVVSGAFTCCPQFTLVSSFSPPTPPTLHPCQRGSCISLHRRSHHRKQLTKWRSNVISSFSTEHRRHRGTSVKLTAAAMTSGSSSGKVLLARALESTSSWIIKHILFSQCSSLTFTRFDIVATRLHLGFVPLLIPFLPMLIWKFRRYIWASIMCGTFLQFIAGNSQQTGKFSKRVLDAFESGKRKVWHMMRMKPSTIAYSIAVSNQDVNGSILAEPWLRQILRSLVQNSLIGAAAALGGAQDAVQSRIEDEYRERGLKRWRRTGNTRLLPFSGGANSDGGALTSTQSNQQSLVNSALLSATSFDLKETYFADGRLVLSAEAILNEENGRKKVLPFTIRTKLEPTKVDYVYGSNGGRLNRRLDRRKDYNALGFVIPECRLNTSPLTAGTLLGRFVPDIVWITFGLGVVVPFGMHSQIYRADVEIDKAVPGAEVCKLDGSISMFAVHNETANVVSIVRSK